MRLDSARALKQEIFETLQPPPGTSARRATARSAEPSLPQVLGARPDAAAGALLVSPPGAAVGAVLGSLVGGPAGAVLGARVQRRLDGARTQLRTLALGVAPRGRGDFALAVRLQRRDLEGSAIERRIRERARGEVEVRYVGRVEKLAASAWVRQRVRPLNIGLSIGVASVGAGTLGAFVRDRGGRVLVLSNNHVLANENRSRRGAAVLQPGTLDGGHRGDDAVATLARSVNLKARRPNLVDCAVAALADGVAFEARRLRGLGTLRSIAAEPPRHGTRVAKLGRTTGLTRGRVTAIEVDYLTVDYDLGALRFDQQIEIEGAGRRAFSDAGDSGSLIVDAAGRALALLFAGSDQGGRNGKGLTYATPIQRVLDALDVDLLL